jgi:RpiR family carbohydrate utilization transcriptional regulator
MPSSSAEDTRQANSLARIRSHLPELAAYEARVAQWVLEDPQRVVNLSMAQIAKECGVSDSTVLRFCRSAGFYGFMDLKICIVRDLARPTEIIHDKIQEGDDTASIVRKVFASNTEALRDTLEVMNYEAFERALELITRARLTMIIGVGTSGPIALDAYAKFFRLGLTCKAQTDSYLQLMEVALLSPGDLLLGISQSGGSADPVMTMRLAKENGVSTICITGNAQSPITQYADVTLLSVSHEKRAETIASRIAQISIIDALYVCLALRSINSTVRNEKLIWDAVLPKTV